MVCSLCYMLATIKLHGMLFEDASKLLPIQRESIKWKKILFNTSIASTVGLLVFFAKHRFYCHDLGKSATVSDCLQLNPILNRIHIFLINHSFQLVRFLRVCDRHCEYAFPFHHHLGLSIAIYAYHTGTKGENRGTLKARKR